MLPTHLVRVGVMGHIGRFGAVDGVRYPRDARVIVRTERGLEIGDVLSQSDALRLQEAEGLATGLTDAGGPKTGVSLEVEIPAKTADGQLLRRMTVEDELLATRLEKNRNEAFDACAKILAKDASSATLFDVEYLFDGKGLYFYFLGDVDPALEERLTELAETYDAVAQLSQFAETLTNGCGPDCGTEAASGNGCGTCTSCTIADACKAHNASI